MEIVNPNVISSPLYEADYLRMYSSLKQLEKVKRITNNFRKSYFLVEKFLNEDHLLIYGSKYDRETNTLISISNSKPNT